LAADLEAVQKRSTRKLEINFVAGEAVKRTGGF